MLFAQEADARGRRWPIRRSGAAGVYPPAMKLGDRMDDWGRQWGLGAVVLFCGGLLAIMVGTALWFGLMLLAELVGKPEAWAIDLLKASAFVWLPFVAGGVVKVLSDRRGGDLSAQTTLTAQDRPSL